MGVALLWKLSEPGELSYADAVPQPGTVPGYLVGVGWLLAGTLLAVAAVLLVTHRRWRVVAVVGAVLSSAVIGLNPGQAIVDQRARARRRCHLVGVHAKE